MNLGHSQKNQNQPTKILLYSFEDPEGQWEQDGTDWYRWALPVYRMPQASWDETEGFTRQKIWFVEKVFSEDPTDPNDIDFPPWFQCYWDSQAGRWVIISSGGASGDYVVFEFASDGSSSVSSGSVSESSGGDDLPENCDERQEAIGPFLGRVVRKSCGMDQVPGENAEGLIELDDPIGILDRRDYRDMAGRLGLAVRMKSQDEPSVSLSAGSASQDDCVWVIVIVNFWRVVKVVTDFIFDGKDITVKYKNITVWDDCQLPDEIIEGIDCEESSSSGSAAAGSSEVSPPPGP